MRVLNVGGRLLLALGVLVLLFTAYQLWGTGIGEQHSQSQLRSHLDRELPRDARGEAKRLSTTPTTAEGGGTTSTTPPEVAPTVTAPAPGQPVGEIDIPTIGLDQVVVEGVTTTDLRLGPGHYPGTPLPGELGNASIAGHRTTYAHPFYSLNAVVPGVQIVLTTPQGVFVYTSVSQKVVDPTDVSVLDATTTPTLTLTTCNPRYSATTRLVVQAVLTRSRLFSGAGTTPSTTAPPPGKRSAAASRTGTLAGTSGGGSVLVACAWGAAVVAVIAGTLLLTRLLHRPRRWLVEAIGLIGLLAVLWFFFGAVSPLLPASL